MTTLDAAANRRETTDKARALDRGTLVSAAVAVCIAQVALAIPAVLNGLFQQDLGTTSSELTWISDAFLVPVTLLELTFGVLGDLFGRKRLLVGGAILIALGSLIALLTPGSATSTGTRVLVLWTGQIVAGIGAAAVFPTTLAMVAAGTHTVRHRARSVSIWAAALSTGGFISPVIGGLVTKAKFGNDAVASWRWAFVAVLVLSVFSAVVSARFAKNSSAPSGRSLDWPGQITIAVALFALLFGVIQGPTSGWGSGEVIGAFVLAAVAFALFIVFENRSTAPLLRLSLFRNRPFAIAAVVTVFGMFSFLGTAYSTSIRLSAIQGFTPLRTSIAFVLLNGTCLLLLPLTSRLLERYNPKWTLGAGAALIGVGDLWMSTISATTTALGAVVVPLALIGVGFGFAVSAVTAVAVNTVPNNLAGMASGSTSLLRDFGFTLGPAVIGAIALSRAANQIQAKVSSNAALQHALAAFNGSAAAAPPDQRASVEGAIGAVNSGPLGANAVPDTVTLPTGQKIPFNPLKHVAFHALDNAYSLGYLICGVAALLAAALAILALGGRSNETLVTAESLA
jgi:MFS family permease